ncbi:hypothetical protein [Alteribacter aurantiacus]|nr:hypothetical protein [Alteribacter aurantiacus]
MMKLCFMLSSVSILVLSFNGLGATAFLVGLTLLFLAAFFSKPRVVSG